MKSPKTDVAVFFGGDAGSHDLSEQTALWLCYFLPRNRYRVTPVRITEQGAWQVPLGSLPDRGPIHGVIDNLFRAVASTPPAQGLERLLRRPIKALVTLLRGRGGDDGALHGLGETLGIPVIGSRLSVCQRASDKHVCALSLEDIVLAPATRRYQRGEDVGAIVDDVRGLLVPPLFIKPVHQEGSVGVTEALGLEQLGAAVHAVRDVDDILVQQRSPGTEVTVTLYDDERGSVHSLPSTVVTPGSARYFDHLAKRRAGRVGLHTEAHDDPLIREAEEIAHDVYRELGSEGLVSFDFVAGDDATELLDINTVPTLTELTPLMHQLRSARVHPGTLFDRFIRRRLGDT